MKKLFVLFLLSLSFVLTSGCTNQTPNTWDAIKERGFIIVGLDDTFAPMGFRNNSGELIGFDVDLAKEVGTRLGVEIKFQPIDWDSKVLELNSGTIDMIWNGLTITEARMEEMLFSDPYIANTQMIMIKKDASINLISDLSGKKVGVQISSAAQDAVNANPIVDSFETLLKYDQYNQALLELKNGTIDAVVIDEIMGRYVMSQSNNEYGVAQENFATENYGIGFRLESNSIRDKINETLIEMIADGKASEISIKWFNEDIILK